MADMIRDESAEQRARDLLERCGVEDAQRYTAGDVVELANLIAEHDRRRRGDRELAPRVLEWCKRHDGGRLGVWWPAGSKSGDGCQPIMAVMWDGGGTGEIGVFYDEKDADKMELICDVFNWAIEQLAPSEQSFYGERTYLNDGDS